MDKLWWMSGIFLGVVEQAYLYRPLIHCVPSPWLHLQQMSATFLTHAISSDLYDLIQDDHLYFFFTLILAYSLDCRVFNQWNINNACASLCAFSSQAGWNRAHDGCDEGAREAGWFTYAIWSNFSRKLQRASAWVFTGIGSGRALCERGSLAFGLGW